MKRKKGFIKLLFDISKSHDVLRVLPLELQQVLLQLRNTEVKYGIPKKKDSIVTDYWKAFLPFPTAHSENSKKLRLNQNNFFNNQLFPRCTNSKE